MTQEEKAKRYDEALEKARRYYDEYKTRDNILYVEDMEDMFPELKESEDERIKSLLISSVKNEAPIANERNKELAIAWLEKQGEQKTADKVEPKFKVGDWIIDIQRVAPNKIIGYEDDNYLIKTSCSQFYLPMKLTEKNYRLWTIQDAKDGDVLNSMRVRATVIFKGFAEDGKHINAYFALQSGIFVHQEMLWDRDFEPASEHWKNALFDAMKEAGYEWDAEKKELKKIEQRPAWSEEDEKMVNDIIKDLVHPWNEYIPDRIEEEIKWLKNRLKSLIPQSHWKPSDEQMLAINTAINVLGKGTINGKYLIELQEQLKKLKE